MQMAKEKLLLLFRTSRPLFWPVLPLVFAAALRFSGASWSWQAIMQALLLGFPYCLLLYGINDIYDYASDLRNPRKRGQLYGIVLAPVHHPLVKKAAALCAGMLLLSSFFPKSGSNLLAMGVLLISSYAYSAPPLRTKTRPILDSLSNAVFYFLAPFALGWSFSRPLLLLPPKIYLVALAMAGYHALSTIGDYTVDRSVGDRTIAVAIGKRATAIIAAACSLVPLLFGGIKASIVRYALIACVAIPLAVAAYPSEKLTAFLVKLVYAIFLVSAVVYSFL